MSTVRLRSTGWSRGLQRTLLPALLACAWAAPAAAQTVWELTPYRVRVILATGPAPELTGDLQADLQAELLTRVDTLLGAAWDADVRWASDELRRVMIRDFQRVTVDLLKEELWRELREATGKEPSPGEQPAPEQEGPDAQGPSRLESLDKIILLAVLPGPDGYEVRARELDVRTRQWNTTVSAPALHPAKLRDAAFRAVLRAFAPLARIAGVDEEDRKRITLRLRASGFPPPDETVATVRPGDVFQPIIRHNDRYGKLRGVRPLEWTFLHVEARSGGVLDCRLHTGLRSPLSARVRGQFEQLAVAAIPTNKPTRLVLQSRTQPRKALAGYDVYSHPPDSKTTELIGRTDQQGSVIVPPAESPLRVLVVKSGAEFLARLPLVPGMQPELVADIRSDDERLKAEGFIRGLQEELIDLVTRREVLLAQAQKRIEEKKLEEARKLIEELRTLEGRDDFDLYLQQEQKRVFSADKLAQAKIDQMFRKTRELVNFYLDPAAVDQLERVLHDVRTGKVKTPLFETSGGAPTTAAATSAASSSEDRRDDAAASPAPPNQPILFQPQFAWANREASQQGTGFFTAGPGGKVAGVTSAHFLDFNGPALLEATFLAVPTLRPLASFTRSWGPPGNAGTLEPIDLRRDYLLMPAEDEVPAQVLLHLDDRDHPDVGERVWLPDKNFDVQLGFDLVEGRVMEAGQRYLVVQLDRRIKLQSQSGSPILSQRTGNVIGTLSRAQEDQQGRTLLLLAPANSIRAALASQAQMPPLRSVVGRQ